jgi:hypothetical protein
MLATWGLAIVGFVVCYSLYLHRLIQQHLTHSRPPQPIFPITAACMIALFFAILYIGRSLNDEARLGSAFIGAIAAPMIFEFPFDLILMTRIYPTPDPALYRVLFFAPLFLVEFTTLALLSLSPLVRLSKAAFFAFALMLLIFAVWALFGFGFPSSPLPFAFNAVSKVVAFVVALSLFLPQRGQASTLKPTDSASLDDLGHRTPGTSSSTARYLCSVTLSSHSMNGSVNHQAGPMCKESSGTPHQGAEGSVTTFSTVSRARLRHAMRGPSPAQRVRELQTRSAGEECVRQCERDHLVLSGE